MALIGVINAVLWPLLARLTLRLMVLTAGLLALVLNGALVLAAGALLPGFAVSGLGDAVLASLILTAVNLAGQRAAGHRRRRLVLQRRHPPRGAPHGPAGGHRRAGRVHARDRRPVRADPAPRHRRRARAHDRALAGGGQPPPRCPGSATSRARPRPARPGSCWATTPTSPPSAGTTRREGRIVVSSSGADCAALEKRLSDGDGLLADDGVSVGQPALRRRAAVAVHVQHGLGAQQAAEGPAGPVRQPVRRDPDRHADGARDGRRALVGAAPADARRAAADQAHAQVRADPRRRDRRPARPERGHADGQPVRRHAGGLRHLLRLRRGGPPLGHRAR